METQISQIEQALRSGQIVRARRELLEISRKPIPRPFLASAANLARRAGLSPISVKILHPFVRPAPRLQVRKATSREQAEYAASLINIGATLEGMRILEDLPTEGPFPDPLLFRAYGLFSHWNYADAIPLLETFIGSESISDYQRKVGEVNLAAALVFECKDVESEKLLKKLSRETRDEKFRLLHGNVLEIQAQNEIRRRNWNQAEVCLSKASHLLASGNSGALDEFFIRKWKAIADLLRKTPNKESIVNAQRIRAEAVTRQHWETMRDMDFHLACATQNSKLMTHLYYGSPYPSYRKKIESEFKGFKKLPAVYRWTLGHLGKAKKAKVIYLGNGGLSWSPERLKQGQAQHRLLGILSSDFYRPFSVAALHSELFPDDFFRPVSSPDKVHQLKRRLRSWFSKNEAPLFIRERNGFYQLDGKGISIEIPLKQLPSNSYEAAITRVREKFPNQDFSTNQVAELLTTNPRSALRVLRQAVKENDLERVNAGPTTSYRFAVSRRDH